MGRKINKRRKCKKAADFDVDSIENDYGSGEYDHYNNNEDAGDKHTIRSFILFSSGGASKEATFAQQMTGHSPLRNIIPRIILKSLLTILQKSGHSPPSNNQLKPLRVSQTNINLKTILKAPSRILRRGRRCLLQNNLFTFLRVKQTNINPKIILKSPLRITRKPRQSPHQNNLLTFLRVKKCNIIPKTILKSPLRIRRKL